MADGAGSRGALTGHDVPIEFGVGSSIDGAHAAFAEFAGDAVVGHGSAGRHTGDSLDYIVKPMCLGPPDAPSPVLASPKSRILTTPSGVTLMLAGLRSR